MLAHIKAIMGRLGSCSVSGDCMELLGWCSSSSKMHSFHFTVSQLHFLNAEHQLEFLSIVGLGGAIGEVVSGETLEGLTSPHVFGLWDGIQ